MSSKKNTGNTSDGFDFRRPDLKSNFAVDDEQMETDPWEELDDFAGSSQFYPENKPLYPENKPHAPAFSTSASDKFKENFDDPFNDKLYASKSFEEKPFTPKFEEKPFNTKFDDPSFAKFDDKQFATPKFEEKSFSTPSFDDKTTKWDAPPPPPLPSLGLDGEDGWEEDAWFERWRMNPEKYLVTALPPELSKRIEDAVRERNVKRNDFVLTALEQACRRVEMDKVRRKGLSEGERAKLIKDPQTGKYRCFPADYFTKEELVDLDVISGTYYQRLWEKTDNGWIQVNKGYFEANGDQDSPYIKMVNNKPVGSWEVYPFEFFEHDWQWGIYDNPNVVIEVKGRKEGDILWLDVYVDRELVDSVKTAREVHRLIMEYHG